MKARRNLVNSNIHLKKVNVQNFLHTWHFNYPAIFEFYGKMSLFRAPITRSDISHKAFLSLFQRTVEGLASWVRMWCHLTSSEICFWKAPEDEGNGKVP